MLLGLFPPEADTFVSSVPSQVSTKMMHHTITDTTDVQQVIATSDEVNNVLIVQCDFILGSNAHGCMVILVGELGNITVNLTRENLYTLTTLTINKMLPLSCYHKIIAFDIESDKSVGTLAVSGSLVGSITDICSSESTTAILYPTRTLK